MGPLQSRGVRLGFLLLVAAAVRLAFFTGFAYGDDVFYISAATALVEGQGWPPLPLHWHTRLGLTVPTALSIAAFGWSPLAFVLLPFLASLAGVWLCFQIVHRVVGERAAWLAGGLQAVFPLEVIYSTHLFPDVVLGNLAALAVWLWVVGLMRDSPRAFMLAGAAFSAGYLCRETIVLELPVLAALWVYYRRVWRPRLLWFALVPMLTLGGELALYAQATGDPFYRWRAVLHRQVPDSVSQGSGQFAGAAVLAEHTGSDTSVAPSWRLATGRQVDPIEPDRDVERQDRSGVSARPRSDGRFDRFTDPLWMLVTSHEFSVFHVLSVPLALLTLWRRPRLRWVALWLLTGLTWLYYGTTVPTAWVPMHPDPRYAASFTIPSVLLIAAYLAEWRTRVQVVAMAVLVSLALTGSSLDRRGSELSAYRALLASAYAREASFEPFDYYAARWASGLRTPVEFACAADVGRDSVVTLADALPGAAVVPTSARRYFVSSARARPGLPARMVSEGWRHVTEITGTEPVGRRWLSSVLRFVPGQGRRFAQVGTGPRLVVLENPAFSSNSGSAHPPALRD